MYTPLNYEQINTLAGLYHPSNVKSFNNQTFQFWERALYQRALSVIDFTLPDKWVGGIKDLFEFCMLTLGYVAVFERKEYGLTFQPCSVKGYDWYYRPTDAIIANPAITESLDLKIGEECEILKLTPDFEGIRDVLEYYAEKLSTLDNAINMSLINNKYALLMTARNKAASMALQKMIDKINKGEPAVIIDQKVKEDAQDSKSDPWNIWTKGNLKECYLTTDQLADFRTLLHNFDSEIGIPTLPIEKRERMISAEATALESDATSRSRVWVETINESAKDVNRHFGTNISARLSWDDISEEVADSGNTNDDRII